MNMSFLKREPVVLNNALTGVIETGLLLAVAFGLQLTSAQIGAIMAFVVALLTLVRILLVRPQVTPVADPRDNAGHPVVLTPARPS